MTAEETAIVSALRLLQQGDIAAAERELARLAGEGQDPRVLHALGTIRLRQQRLAEAEGLFSRARTAAPRQPQPAFHHGQALAELGRAEEAIAAFRTAITLKPDYLEAYYELGGALQRARQWENAERAYRKLLELAPGHVPAKLGLGAVLIEAKRPAEAEIPLRRALSEPAPPRLTAMLHTNLGLALRHQRKDEEALENYAKAGVLDAALPGLDIHRAEALQNLRRYDEALAAYQQALAREPRDPQAHRFYNDLLYRLGRTDEYLKSFDRAPKSRELLLGKAQFLAQQKRGEESHAIYRELLTQNPGDGMAAAGVAEALLMLRRPGEAVAAYEAALARHGRDAPLYGRAAEAALLAGDPQRALALCEQGLAINPHDHTCLATMSAALRLMQDERDEILNGYDSLIQVFDLDPPEGFSSMESFNVELNVYLDRLHPETREYINQSLRGGTQTPDHVFGAGHELVNRLEARIAQTVGRYIAGLKEDDKHPFLSRRSREFRYAGSWSSRLKDCGFHVNHVHPDGWISSCYYVAVPQAAQDESARQGWIKFGEPSFDIALKNPVRRAIQPVPGRLVLFPSYMWHGTIPFHDAAARTTIAFDAVPSG